MPIELDDDDTCQYDQCDKSAQQIVFSYSNGVELYCDEHGDKVLLKEGHGVDTSCPNCSCRFGVD